MFDVEVFINSQLVDHTYKIPSVGQVYDRYLIEEYYEEYLRGNQLDDPIIKYKFNDQISIDQSVSGPAKPKNYCNISKLSHLPHILSPDFILSLRCL